MTVYVTENSLWIVDEDAHIVTRLPRSEDPSHPTLSYQKVGQPQNYDEMFFATNENRAYWVYNRAELQRTEEPIGNCACFIDHGYRFTSGIIMEVRENGSGLPVG